VTARRHPPARTASAGRGWWSRRATPAGEESRPRTRPSTGPGTPGRRRGEPGTGKIPKPATALPDRTIREGVLTGAVTHLGQSLGSTTSPARTTGAGRGAVIAPVDASRRGVAISNTSGHRAGRARRRRVEPWHQEDVQVSPSSFRSGTGTSTSGPSPTTEDGTSTAGRLSAW
jgi:hypothetical protein